MEQRKILIVFLLSVIAISACNLSSKVPAQYNYSDITRMSYYLKMMRYYANKSDTLTLENYVTKYEGLKNEIYRLEKMQLITKANFYLQQADSVIKIIKQDAEKELIQNN